MLVEDEPVIRLLLAEALRNEGLRVIEASNADDAWTYLQAGGDADLVFSDITMPGSINGLELMRRIATAYPELKRIITSANPGRENVSALGLFLAKPYRLETAAKATLDLLGREAK